MHIYRCSFARALLLCTAFLLIIASALNAQSQPTLSPELRKRCRRHRAAGAEDDGRAVRVCGRGAGRKDRLCAGVWVGASGSADGRDACDALQHRLDQQAVHGGGGADARAAGQAVAGRYGFKVYFRPYRRRQGHHARAAVAYLGIPGFLAAGLCSAAHAETDLGRTDHGYVGAQAARFSAGNKVAVQQHQLRDCRSHRGESLGQVAAGASDASVSSRPCG